MQNVWHPEDHLYLDAVGRNHDTRHRVGREHQIMQEAKSWVYNQEI